MVVVLNYERTWLASGSPTPRKRAQVRARERTVFTVTWGTCRRNCSTCVASPRMESKRGVTCPRGITEPGDVVSKRGVTWSRGVTEPGGVARGGVETWREARKCSVKMWRQGARWRRQMWRQNVASLARVASGSQVASPDVVSKRGVTCPRRQGG